MPKIGIIGGSGVYDPEIFENAEKKKIDTPYGLPSDMLTFGEINGVEVAFLPRHGEDHSIPPHEVNYRANIYALNEVGVDKLLALSAVGSLSENIAPGDFVLPNQFIDETKNRNYTFYDGPQVAHIQIGDEPFCPELRSIIEGNSDARNGGTIVIIEGPRFSTKAESKIWKDVYNADIVSMTLAPEVTLAREKGMCYVNLASVTDYDIWAEDSVTATEVENVAKKNLEKSKEILYDSMPDLEGSNDCDCEEALENAFL